MAATSASPRWTDRDAPAVLLLLLLVVAAWADPLLARRTFVGRDIVPYVLPLEKAVHGAWARGTVPVWWDAISGGRPLLPNPNAGVFYPLRVALAALPFPEAMRVFPIAHWFLAGWGMFRLMRAAGGSRGAAWIAAVSYAFSGVVVSEIFYYAFLPGVALLPWSLWALARPGGGRIPRVVPIAIAYGLMLLAGDAFTFAIAVLSGVLWIVLETPRAERAGDALRLGIGLVLGGLLALPQVVATALVAPETRRAVTGIPLREVFLFSVPPARLLELAIPYPFGPAWSMDLSLDWGAAAFRRFFTSFFVGPIAVYGLLSRFRESPPGTRFARALTGICLALALAGNLVPVGGALGAATSPIPLRYPEKFMLGAAMGLSVAAGTAVDRMRRRGATRGVLAGALALAVAAIAAGLFPAAAGAVVTAAVGAPPAVPRALAGRELSGALADAGLLWAATAVAIALLWAGGRERLSAALVLLTVVPVVAGRPIGRTQRDEAVYPPTAFARAIARRDPAGVFRGIDEAPYRTTSLRAVSERGDWAGTAHYRESWLYYTPALFGRPAIFNGDLDVGDFSRLDSLRQVANLAALRTDSEGFFESLSLRYGVRFRDQEPLAGFRAFGGDALRRFDENPAALPPVRLLESWREAPGPVPALAALPRLAPGAVVIETGREGEGSARPGSVRVVERNPEALRLATSAPDPTWLFVLRGDWDYRAVSVDGRPVPVHTAQLAFSAVRIPAGEHRVEWREEAPGLEVSRWGPVAALLILGVAVVRVRGAR
ncbi:MAG TPA: hypothetical protein VGH97_06790 [Thermoanaerobaculia bacterium]